MREGHISKAFDGELAALHIHVLELGGLVLKQIHDANHAYTAWDLHRAQEVAVREGEVLATVGTINDEQLRLLARRTPVASDLRNILALGRISNILERSAGEARKMARAVQQHAGRPARATTTDVQHLAHLALDLLRRALVALDTVDPALAADVIAHDQDLDREYATGLRRLLSRAMENPAQTEMTVEAAFVLKSLEKIGDRARDIALLVAAMAEDEDAPQASA